ncbi:MAG: YbhB/YbcL family Raf kinase inhibitor-like protein [Candidatus Bathyarchaeia archaeon]
MPLILSSKAFKNGEHIPSKYTADGENVSPPLNWHGAPRETATFALIVDDLDAQGGLLTHWIIFNIPASENNLSENMPKTPRFPYGAAQGRNDFQRIGWEGPCSSSGTHRYRFQLYAIDCWLTLSSGASREEVLQNIERHTHAKAELTVLYDRN